ncbi:putative P2Y purinoceptor 10 [Tympanuchus pallidicinctus]|uniref:putative P2Y purinoceptor 10 n=1 Tax=Tympanuchus pallidicinctus TaxID=109042 RepID=UPI0022872DF2|nr:putative P2Y purinoceptor 10 [Tympanuchus pallidicinctus]XP_052529041.1 putative P2Y purinoceptor 10 [Tympanuchus pallidicinctus]
MTCTPPPVPNAPSSPIMTHSNWTCSDPNVTYKSTLYAATYTIIFIPGLLANSAALWVLCRFISKKNKAIIFMINLAAADLAHVLSLPLRIYYYMNRTWPFGRFLCLLCFYLKYLNMYASICFLTCISIQRYLFLLHPFKAKDWKRRYDIAISAAVWLFVGAACSPFPIMRSFRLQNNSKTCFADLEVRQIESKVGTVAMTATAELFGFIGPLIVIVFCTWKTKVSLRGFRIPLQNNSEGRKASRMVSTCAIVFFVCFAPYHINFFFYMMVKENVITDCLLRRITLHTQPFCLTLASLDCCLDPILYFFMTSEFQDQISRHSSMAIRSRLMSKESASSVKE